MTELAAVYTPGSAARDPRAMVREMFCARNIGAQSRQAQCRLAAVGGWRGRLVKINLPDEAVLPAAVGQALFWRTC